MNYGPLIFLGFFFTFACSWLGMVFLPVSQLGNQQVTKLESGEFYPSGRLGVAHRGAEIYRANGCASCHTEQVRGNIDIPRWGKRFSAPQDYLDDQPMMPGSLRIGPDLANVGSRIPDEKWHLMHLYNPQTVAKGSKMPPYRFLFEKRKMGRIKSNEALDLSAPFTVEKGFEIIPTSDARALVAYLLSLKSDVSILEAPLPKTGKSIEQGADTNAVSAVATNDTTGTNISVNATNSPAK